MNVEIQLAVMLVFSLLGFEAKKKHREPVSSTEGMKTISDVIENLCLPKRTDRLVYRFKNETHIYVGFDNLKECTVYSMTWKIHEEILYNRGHTDYDLEPATEVRGYPQQYVFAAAGERQQRMFKEAMEDCSYSITFLPCLMEVFAKTARKMKKVDFVTKCDTQWSKQCDKMQI